MIARQPAADLGTAAAAYFEPFARGVAAACVREGRTATTVAASGRIGIYGLRADELAAVATRYGYGEATPERLLSGSLQHDLSRALLSEYWRREIRLLRNSASHPDSVITTAAIRATRAWLADRETGGPQLETVEPYSRNHARFLTSVMSSMGFAENRELEQKRERVLSLSM